MSEEKLLNIIIVNYNNWRYLADCLASIFKSTIPEENYKIIVVDNASTDLSIKLVEYLIGRGKPILLIKNSENLNYVLGNNIGLKCVNSKFVLLLNNDTILNKDCISEMLNIFKLEPKAGMVGAIQHSEFHGLFATSPLGKFNRNPNDWSSMGAEPCDDVEKLPKPYIEVDNTNSACAMIPSEAIKKIGYFDERFSPCMYECEDYVLRLKFAGYKILVCTTAKLIHFVARTTNIDLNSQSFYNNVVLPKNRKLFNEKWGEKFKNKEI